MKNKTSKIFSAVYFVCIISCILLSAVLVYDVAARYFSEASGSDSARVAKWDVQIESSSSTMNFSGSNCEDSAEILEYQLTVESKSEVTMEYAIVVTFQTPPPAQIKLCIDNGQWVDCDGTQTEFSFGKFPYAIGEGEKQHQLKIQVTYMNGETPYTFNFANVPVTITVTAEQVN